MGDSYFLCPSLSLLKALSKRQAAFGYVYTYINGGITSGLKAHHGADLMYAFGADANRMISHSKTERKFANDIVAYFSKFVKTGTC